MFEFLLASENLVFSSSLILLLLIAIIQILGLGEFGVDADVDGFDMDMDGDLSDGISADSGLLALFGFGKLPLLMLLMVFLTCFSLIGFSGQQFMESLIGNMLSPWLAVPVAAIAALPLTGMLAHPLSKLVPRDETTAVSIHSLVGRFAEITIGTARQGSPARAKVTDVHGHSHHVMVEPDNEGQSFTQGEKLLLVRREGRIFRAIAHGDKHLPSLDA